ncbi:MAG: hypothetical protein R3190_17405, partial [Thermoanaerobaculia bacterium]|nr:hypothetical protein [Thermoanaerobaculia bacterium]
MPTLRLSLVDLHARFLATALAFAAGGALLLPEPADASRRRGGGAPLEAQGFALFTSPQANPIALSADGTELYVANTTSNTVDVISTASNTVTSTVRVGIDPVAVAPRPGSSEVWVSNHVSDSVSVIDTSLVPPEVSQTVQDIGGDRVTDFDEPVGIAFNAAGTKAYVALSSRNEIAVVDTSTYSVTNRLSISAQDPRALTVANGLLYVAAFESGNQSELAACLSTDPQGFDQCSLDDNDLAAFAQDPNLPGLDKNIVIDTDLPDRDLFVFDTNDDSAVDTVTGIGTLLYGVAADSSGTAYLSLTNARNDANGRTCNTVNNATCNSAGGDSDVNGDNDDNLQDLQNRIFENLIAEVSCTAGGGCGSVTLTDLEPSLPATADDAAQDGSELATPYGIRVSGDGSTLVVTAA